MLKRWYSIKEIDVYLLREILTSKDTLHGQKKRGRASVIRLTMAVSNLLGTLYVA